MYNNKSIGCVFLNYNSTSEIIQRIADIRDYNIIDHFVIVDNNSSDNAQHELLNLVCKKIDVVLNDVNGGYAAGNNIGIKYLQEMYHVDYICVCNPDVIFDEECIERLLSIADQKPMVGLISCIIKTNANHKPPVAWKLPNYMRCISESMLFCNKIVEKNYMYAYNTPVQKVDVICGAFFIATSSALSDVRLFDERTFLYYEENILAFKLKEKGYSNYLVTDCSVYHEVSASINKEYKTYIEKAKLMQKSKKIYCKYYLKVHKLKLFVADAAFYIGVGEVTVCHAIRNLIFRYRKLEKKDA